MEIPCPANEIPSFRVKKKKNLARESMKLSLWMTRHRCRDGKGMETCLRVQRNQRETVE